MVYYQSIQVIRINWYYIYYEQTIFLLQIILENNWSKFEKTGFWL
jgi:hypothetical protein